MTKILLVRHGHVEGIHPPRFRGRTELALTPLGVAQAQAVAQRIAAVWMPSVVYTSPLSRCVATGEAVARACGIAAHVLDDLVDIDYGVWQFKSFDEMKEENPRLFTAWLTTPELVRFQGGESLQDVVARGANALRFVLERHPGETVVLVGHDNLNRAFLLQPLDQPLSAFWRLAQDPCCINEIDIGDGKIEVCRLNDTAHLNGLDAPGGGSGS